MVLDVLTMVFLVLAIGIIIAVLLEYSHAPGDVIDYCEYRKNLLAIVQHLRLCSMISLLNIPIKRYISIVPVTEIEDHVSACKTCGELETCDRCLRDGVPAKDMSFCPNYVSLVELKKMLHKTG